MGAQMVFDGKSSFFDDLNFVVLYFLASNFMSVVPNQCARANAWRLVYRVAVVAKRA
jgi:hypothetical protein